MRAFVAALIAPFLVPAAVAAGGVFDPVDLSRPGVLERMKRDQPSRYLAVAEILRVSRQAPCKPGELEVIKTRYDVRDWECTFLVLTSYPAKRHVRFELEGTKYVANVTLKDADARLLPAVDR